ncbi:MULTISPECIES: alpha/beta hydrolase [unclassified Streptomyces]|uniref:alpha/beta fold hydrolase n=1 Tax=unclassified Streptomyces TaxID=2593676 RepID=UPI000DB94FD8|nr:alpha/beta hydrolase [Streptomyces sp. PsTaAH-137]MYT72690.1 alpha/beta fold hydrolase [Streptomyces sp. SID8367]RAJ79547.1 pimeloyl-ACP methyl ester carboxylesterase [Streptomyces sp. PsTaAH-137]
MSRLTHVRTGPYAPPVAAEELTVTSADGARLHVEVHGPADAPAVVLAHGWTCSTAFWAAQTRALATDHRVIVYDQRGHGRSPASAQLPYTTDMLADDLEAVLGATLAPGQRAVLAGHSMGGMTLMAAAGRAKVAEHAAALLLCSTGSSRLVAESTVVPLLRPGGLRTRLTRAVLGSKAPLGPVTPVGKKVLRYATMGPGSAPDKVEACARIVHACPRGVRHGWSQVLEQLQVDAGVRELTMPVAVLAGTADRMTPVVLARRIASELPNCVGLTELPGLGHMTPIEAPDAVTGKIRELSRTYIPTPAQVEQDRKTQEEGVDAA